MSMTLLQIGGSPLDAPVAAICVSDVISRLDALNAELTALGWTARIRTPLGRRPSLYVRNPEPGAAALSEHVYAHPRTDGQWLYWWPWADPIADTAAQAAAIIVHVLRPAEKRLADEAQRVNE